MKARFAWVALLGFVLIAAAACSRSDGLTETEEEALQEQVEAAEAAKAEAERLRQEAEAAEAQAEADRKAAQEAREAAEAEAKAAQEAQEKAEAEAKAAEEAREKAAAEAEEARKKAEAEEAERRRQAAAAAEAERLLQAEEDARRAAEAERQRLANEAEARRRADAAEAARTAISGSRMIGDEATLAVAIPIEHGEPADVTTPPGPFTTTIRPGRWSITTHNTNAEPTRDMIQIYSDVEAPSGDPFSTSPLNTGTNVGGPAGTTTTEVIDSEEDVVGWVNISNTDHSLITASGSFPREPGPPEAFRVVDRGLTADDYANLVSTNPALVPEGTATNEELAAAGIDRQQYNRYRAGTGFRNAPNTPHYPERYAYTTSGQLQGAGGTFRCNAANTGVDCTVQNRGGSFNFVGDWDFIPSSGSVRIVVPDAQHMWFGWWARQTVRLADTPAQSTETWAFQAEHGGTHPVTILTDATGSATYRGPAAGRYAVYEPDTGDSGIGSFTASATLQADFNADTVSGTITGFSNDSSWSLALQRKGISGGAIEVVADSDSVTWTIDGVPDDSGDWEAQFYNNLETNGTVDYQPHGIAGTFKAAYDPSGVGARAAVIGGFGAHR